MKKTICLSLALLMSVAAFPLQAQDTTNEKNQPAPAQEDSAKEEESSIFSFFNFGSKDKKAEDGTTAKQAEEAPKETKIERLTKEADAGNLNSQMALGYIYLYGEDDTKPNPDKAFHYYKLAAEQNDNIAVNNLASLYYSGIGVEQNFAMAAELFRKAVQLGNTEAAVNLELNKDQPNYTFAKKSELRNYVISCLKEYEEHPVFWAVMLRDEPTWELFESAGTLFEIIRDYNPEIEVVQNLLPMYGEESFYHNVVAEGAKQRDVFYKEYLENWLNATGADYIMFDTYPMRYDGIETFQLKGLKIAADISSSLTLTISSTYLLQNSNVFAPGSFTAIPSAIVETLSSLSIL